MKKLCRIALFCFLFALALSASAWAENITKSFTKNDITFQVSYPQTISCGEEVRFEFTAVNASEDVKYRINSLNTPDQVMVYDVSYYGHSNYSTQSYWPFTFYASGTYYIRFNMFDIGNGVIIDTGLYGIPLVINDPDYPSIETIADRVAQECLAAGCTTDYAKALWLNDWIVNHCDYDYSYSYCSAEGALARGKGTCEAHHRAYEMLLARVGVATQRVQSNIHVWTGVKMEGKWYQIDTTWNDVEPKQVPSYFTTDDMLHFYFGLTDDILTSASSGTHDHTPVAGAESVSLDENYFIFTGRIHNWSDEYKAEIRRQLAAGAREFTLAITNPSWPDGYKNVLYSLVAYQLAEKEDWGGYELTATYADNTLSFTARAADLLYCEKKYFGGEEIDVDQLAGDYSAVTATALDAYAPVISGELPAGLSYHGTTLSLDGEEASVRHVFLLTGTCGECSFFLDGEPANLGMQGENYFTADVQPAGPGDYGTAHTLRVADGNTEWTISYSALSYAQKTLTQTPDTEEAKLMQVFAGAAIPKSK